MRDLAVRAPDRDEPHDLALAAREPAAVGVRLRPRPEPLANGRQRLVALEYVVFQADWDPHHASPPELFGEEFELVPAGNRYGLPPFYELHAWLWKHNPAGMFEDWNPRVSCPAA